MKYPIFKVKFLQEEIIVERREMAQSIRLEKLFHIKQYKKINFLFLITLRLGDLVLKFILTSLTQGDEENGTC